MVAVSTINSHGDEFGNVLSSYNSYTSDALAVWKGESSKNFENITESFYTDAKQVINQFAPFAEAIKYYGYLQTYKKNVSICHGNYNGHLNDTDPTKRNYWYSKWKEYENLVASTTEQINSCLEQVGGLIIEGGTGVTEVHSTNAVIQAAIDWALATAADDTHGYSQQTRWGNPNYDCSSFVISAYQNAGTGVKDAGAGYTGNMKSAFEACGFIWIPGRFNAEDLQPGDVLLDIDQHTEMYIGDGKNVGAHSNYDGVNGDSSGKEVSVGNYYTGTWDGVLRYVGNENK